jgi:hypothetical protein
MCRPMRDLGTYGCCPVRKLKLTVNKVSSLRDLQDQKDSCSAGMLRSTRGDT